MQKFYYRYREVMEAVAAIRQGRPARVGGVDFAPDDTAAVARLNAEAGAIKLQSDELLDAVCTGVDQFGQVIDVYVSPRRAAEVLDELVPTAWHFTALRPSDRD